LDFVLGKILGVAEESDYRGNIFAFVVKHSMRGIGISSRWPSGEQVFHSFCQLPGSDKGVAAEEKIGDFVPVDFADVEAEGDPASGCEVGREIESARLGFREGLVVAGEDFAGDGNDAVAVMVVEEISEGLFADEELRVGTMNEARGFRKRKGDFGEMREAGVFAGGFCCGHGGSIS
jgi:hypothetical protein